MNEPVGKVPIKIQQKRYEINKMIAITFGTDNGKKCLEYLKNITIYKLIPTDGESAIARAATNNLVLTLMGQIEQAEAGPPKEGD